MRTLVILELFFVLGTAGVRSSAFQSNVPAQTTSGNTPEPTADSGRARLTPVPAGSAKPRFAPVLISATNGKGDPTLGLTKDQFTVMDNNHVVPLLKVFNASDVPLHLAIVLLAGSNTFSQQQTAAIDLVRKVIRPKVDEAFIVTARGKKPWPSSNLDWKNDPEDLIKAVQSLDPNVGLHDAFSFNMSTSETELDENGGRDTVQAYSGGGMSVFDAVFYMMNSDPRPARRVLVIFRDPWGHSPGFGSRVNTAVENRLQQVIGVAQEMHVATFVIGLEDTRVNGVADNTIGKNYISVHSGENGGGGEGNQAFDRAMQRERVRAYDAGKTNVQRLGAETGGATFWSTKKNFSDAVTAITNLLAGQYIVTFAPEDSPNAAHSLRVQSGASTRILYPTGFFYGEIK
jgi:VWFA-related protein